MSRLEILAPSRAQLVVEDLYKNLEHRIVASPPGLCPVDITRAFIEMCALQSRAFTVKASSHGRAERRCDHGYAEPD